MIKVAICDDEANTRAYLTSLIQAQSFPCEIVEYASAGDRLADVKEIDLLFLDIELSSDQPDGMALAREIREQSVGPLPVSYTKTEEEMANGDRLLLSKYKYQDFVKAYLRFLKRGLAYERDGVRPVQPGVRTGRGTALCPLPVVVPAALFERAPGQKSGGSVHAPSDHLIGLGQLSHAPRHICIQVDWNH